MRANLATVISGAATTAFLPTGRIRRGGDGYGAGDTGGHNGTADAPNGVPRIRARYGAQRGLLATDGTAPSKRRNRCKLRA